MLDHLHITLEHCKGTEGLEPRAGVKMEAVASTEDREWCIAKGTEHIDTPKP